MTNNKRENNQNVRIARFYPAHKIGKKYFSSEEISKRGLEIIITITQRTYLRGVERNTIR